MKPGSYLRTEEIRMKNRISNLGKHQSEETRTKIGSASTGRICTDKTRKKISIANYGKTRSEETRTKISNSKLGKNHPLFGKKHSEKTIHIMSMVKLGKNNPNYGKPQTEEHRRKISLALRGENAPSWKGGISFDPYCPKFNREFKKRVRAFFGYKCVECGKTEQENGRSLAVHHVNYDKMVCCNDVIPLFVALCHSHNAQANSNRGQWEKHYTDIINEKYHGKCYYTLEEKYENC